MFSAVGVLIVPGYEAAYGQKPVAQVRETEYLACISKPGEWNIPATWRWRSDDFPPEHGRRME